MTAGRNVLVHADPAACLRGRDALVERQRAGVAGLDGAIAILDELARKASVPAVVQNRHAVKIHMARPHEEWERNYTAVCGREGTLDSRANERDDVFECTTPVCDMIEMTNDPDFVTCARCRRAGEKR